MQNYAYTKADKYRVDTYLRNGHTCIYICKNLRPENTIRWTYTDLVCTDLLKRTQKQTSQAQTTRTKAFASDGNW